MTRPLALIVSHGQPSDPEVGEAEIAAFADAAQRFVPEITIKGVTLATKGRLEDVSTAAPEGTPVYPLFMADGWFTQVRLPRSLGAAPVRRLPPYGRDLGLVDFATRWLQEELVAARWPARQTTLVVVGHGSGRSRKPSEVTRVFARALHGRLGTRALRLGFVEEQPFLATALGKIKGPALCLPFFATRRGHVLEDLPAAVAESGFTGRVLDPIGCHPETPAFVARRLAAALDLGT